MSGPRFAFLLVLSLVLTAPGADWPVYRGSTGMGVVTTSDSLPLTWGPEPAQNLLWKSPLPHLAANGQPDHNQSSPIITGDRIMVTTSHWPAGAEQAAQQPEHHVVCYSLKDGRLLWDTKVAPGPWRLTDLRGGYTVPTPASDGKRIFVAFGSSIMHALDLEGKLLWTKVIPDHEQFDVAYAPSPLVYQDTVLVLADRKPPYSTLTAYDAATGEVRWEQKRKETSFGHVSPVLVEMAGKPQLLISATNALQSINPDNGEIIWWCNWGRSIWPVSSPVVSRNLVYCIGGRGGHPGLVVDPSGSGDVTATHLKWRTGPSAEGLGSPVAFEGRVYRCNKPGVLSCVRIDSGEELFKERIEELDPSVSPFVTPDGKIYFASAGTSVVFRAGEKLEELGRSNLGDPCPSSAAASGSRIVLKGRDYVWCVGLNEPAPH